MGKVGRVDIELLELRISKLPSFLSFLSFFLQSRKTRRPMERLSKAKPPRIERPTISPRLESESGWTLNCEILMVLLTTPPTPLPGWDYLLD